MMFNSLLTRLKTFGINLSIRPSVNFFQSSFLSRLSQKKMYSFLSRVRAKRTPNQLEPLFSLRIVISHFYVLVFSELLRGFAAMLVCYTVNGLFRLVL